MRTTLTLDDDVAAELSRRRAERGTGLRQEVNDLLRAGLTSVRERDPDNDAPYELPTFDPGRMLITDQRALKDLIEDEETDLAVASRP